MKKRGYQVIPQMFDVKPVSQTGQIEIGQSSGWKKIVKIQPKENQLKKTIASLPAVPKRPFKRPYSLPQAFKKVILPKQPEKKKEQNSLDEVFFEKPKLFQLNQTFEVDQGVPSLIKSNYRPMSQRVYFSDIAPSQEESEQTPKFYHQKVTPEIPAKDPWDYFIQKKEPPRENPPLPAPQIFESKEKIFQEKPKVLKAKKKKSKNGISLKKLFFSNYNQLINPKKLTASWQQSFLRPAFGFGLMLLACSSLVLGTLVASRGWQIKDTVVVKGQQAIGQLVLAKDDLKSQNFQAADQRFSNAAQEFEQAQQQMNLIGGDLLNIFSGLPYLSKASSGKNLIEAGQKLTLTAQKFSKVAIIFSQLDNPLKEKDSNQQSLVDLLVSVNQQVVESQAALEETQQCLERVEAEDLPEEYREKFRKIKETLPLLNRTMAGFSQNYQIFLDILGHNGPRKYLFLFQNNQEMRATGGFVGSYGILDISNGHIKSLFIDGIYNPDGQLRELVVPPKPIQKISASWSMHDSNWFPDFPASAEKAAWFYEKTGGPTVDGVITLTPTVLQKMLEITGPVEMPDYGTTVDKDNFVEKTQYEVEVDYDKQENKPKQFIADLAPKILDQLLAVKDVNQMAKVLKVIAGAMKEKHILIYSFNYNLQQIISQQGWSGQVLPASRDYLMVINSNINGFKTDGVVEESISHQAEIQSDGSIVDTVKIKRVHKGGDSEFEWWNKVNSDYMRLYVPRGSQLLSVSGQTREFNQPPLSYDELGFRHDPQVEQEEQSMKVDEATGTRVYEENEKTVFANWVYVSPKETVEVEYKYVLPFRVDLNKNPDHVDTYSLLAQKQSGSLGSKFESTVSFADNMNVVWKYPELAESQEQKIRYSSDLVQDRFLGFVVQGK